MTLKSSTEKRRQQLDRGGSVSASTKRVSLSQMRSKTMPCQQERVVSQLLYESGGCGEVACLEP